MKKNILEKLVIAAFSTALSAGCMSRDDATKIIANKLQEGFPKKMRIGLSFGGSSYLTFEDWNGDMKTVERCWLTAEGARGLIFQLTRDSKHEILGPNEVYRIMTPEESNRIDRLYQEIISFYKNAINVK